jgi:hypothetical protein
MCRSPCRMASSPFDGSTQPVTATLFSTGGTRRVGVGWVQNPMIQHLWAASTLASGWLAGSPRYRCAAAAATTTATIWSQSKPG